MPAPMSAPLGTHGELCFQPHFPAFGELMLPEHGSAHCHVPSPDRVSFDRPFREVGPAEEALRNTLKHPHWRRLVPDRVNRATENIIIGPCRADILNRNEPIAG